MTQNIDFNKLVPAYLKNDMLDSLMSNLFNRFTSQENSVQIEGRIGQSVPGQVDIQQRNLERKVNSLVPALLYAEGAEQSIFTFNDLIDRMNALGIRIESLREWIAEQTYNFSPPINYDKFINFSNYYWVGSQFTNEAPEWNIENSPEYYLIERPTATDDIKLPVKLATTRNINLQVNDRPPEKLVLSFISNSAFNFSSSFNGSINTTYTDVSVIDSTPGVATPITVFAVDEPDISNPGEVLAPAIGNGQDNAICEFSIVAGILPFAAGDVIEIDIVYFSGQYTATLTSGSAIGKGTIVGVNTAIGPRMLIDGVEVELGDRILVKNQNDITENGIYQVTSGSAWPRTIDAIDDSHFNLTSTNVYVYSGGQAGKSFSVSSGSLTSGLVFSEILPSPPIQLNDWQIYNYWVHKDDLAQMGLSDIDGEVATRPIVEYNRKLELNNAHEDGIPVIGDTHPQRKTAQNQIPHFNLYRYDGTHSGKVGGIFFYKEDASYGVDTVLKRRLKITSNSDYVFELGIKDEEDRLLFFKKSDELQSIWRPGVTTAKASVPHFFGGSDRGILVISGINSAADNQLWTVTFIDSTTASVSGTRSGSLGQMPIDTLTDFEDFSLTISSGVSAFSAGERFTFNIIAPTSPRYVKEEDGQIINFPKGAFESGYAADEATLSPVGAWMTPIRMFQNLKRDLTTTVNYADLLNHMRSVVRFQDGFTGSSYGNNNSRNLEIDEGLGGEIREFGSNFPLLVSMLIQKDMSPLSILDFAERQSEMAISSVDQFIVTELVKFTSSINAAFPQNINTGNEIQQLADYFELLRTDNSELNSVFKDTTAAVNNWPASLAIMGLINASEPDVIFDHELNMPMIKHHDGHVSTLLTNSFALSSSLVQTVVLRSDGQETPGALSETAPILPYAGMLWFKPSTNEVFSFDVDFDTLETPPAAPGKIWFNRNDSLLYSWDIGSLNWIQTGQPVQDRWVMFDIANIRNSLLLTIENRLYSGIHPAQQTVIDLESRIESDPNSTLLMEIELAKFAAKFGLDAFAPDFSATDAFTWNYSQADVSALGLTQSNARWFDLYKSYYAQFSAFEVDRPDLEPWKLGSSQYAPMDQVSNDWLTRYECDVRADAIIDSVKVISRVNRPLPLTGLPTIDGITLNSGDKILLSAQVGEQHNGIYIVSAGAWVRASTVLTTNAGILIEEGPWANTIWVLTSDEPLTIGISLLTFEQERVWNIEMWYEMAALNPSMKLGVNIFTEQLLPPYVSPSESYSTYALLTTIPANIDSAYVFGDNSPVELVWKKSSEFYFSLARVFFKLYPLEFLDKSWGETYIQVGDNLRQERNLMTSLSSDNFLLHGEQLSLISTVSEPSNNFIFDPTELVSTVDNEVVFRVTHCADDLTIFTAFVNGEIALNTVSGDYIIVEGQPFSLQTNASLTVENVIITDRGYPFNLGDSFIVNFAAPISETPIEIDEESESELGCEGCIIPEGGQIVDDTEDTVIEPTFEFVAGRTKLFNGIGQWFTHLLRFSNLDSESSNAVVAYREWDTNLVHRVGALLRPDTLNITTNQGTMPDTGYNVVLHAARNTDSKWITALRIQLVQMGSRVVNPAGLFIPGGQRFVASGQPTVSGQDGADWVFRVEAYNPLQPEVSLFEFDTAGEFVTFAALDKQNCPLDWKHFTSVSNVQTVPMPRQITGIQNVINFVFGYTDYLVQQGFSISSESPITDQDTGRNLDWQLEIEKFIDTVYAGMNAGSAYVLNPFADKLVVQTPVGLLSKFAQHNFVDVSSSQRCFDVLGNAIPSSDLYVVRTDAHSTAYSDTPIYSAHVFIDEYEHVIIFNNAFSTDADSPVVFDPFLGEAISSAHLTFVRQAEANGKPTFNGFYLKGNNVARNIASSVDSIQNVYDPILSFSESLTAEHAMSLVGFKQKSYFDALNINAATQMNFWKSMISAKGTNLALSAFTNYKAFTDSSTDEFWAYKVASYGDAREKSNPEIKIQPNDTTRKFSSFQFFGDTAPSSVIPQHILIGANDDTRWFTIDDLGTNLKFDAIKISEEITVEVGTFPQYVRLKNIYSTDEGFEATVSPSTAEIKGANVIKINQAGTYTVTGYSWINQTKLSPVKLFDYKDNTLVSQIGLWNPAIGVHAYSPLELVNIKDSFNPAYFNYSLQTIDNPNYKALKPWNEKEVGKVWWDTSDLHYVPYYDSFIFPSLESRLARWGSLAEFGSINLYQWTESPVHPSEYNALARLQEGDTSIDESIRLSGEVGFTQYYSSQKTYAVRPIAWSQSSNNSAHPAFINHQVKLSVLGNSLVANTGRVQDIGLESGRHFASWDSSNSIPLNEVIIGDQINYVIGSSSTLTSPVIVGGGSIPTITISRIPRTDDVSTHLGAISFHAIMVSDVIPEVPAVPATPDSAEIPAIPEVPAVFKIRIMDSNLDIQDIVMEPWNLFSETLTSANNFQHIDFDKFGLRLTLTRNINGNISSEDICEAVANVANDIFIRETVNFVSIVPQLNLIGTEFSNNPADMTDFGWRVWEQPSQLQLSADLRAPQNRWQPYIGQLVDVPMSTDLLEALASPITANLILANGITVQRFEQVWSQWNILGSQKKEILSDGVSEIEFVLDNETTIDARRLSIYKNGIQESPLEYVIEDNSVKLVNILPEAYSATLIYRGYVPTAADLTVDENDPKVQTRYRLDYEYTKIDQRSSSGNIIGAKYYFWVKNKSVVQTGERMSLQNATNLLTTGESTFMLFTKLAADENSAIGASYDSCTISGLHNFVGDTDRYKLRFLRDFTLRNDPEEMSLKNTHTEWELLRPRQSTKIPSQIWKALTDAVCGSDIVGDALPSKTRIDYDEKYNTRTRFGFNRGQIFCESELAIDSIINTLLNTSLVIQIGENSIIDYVTMFNINASTTSESIKSKWFSDPITSRNTMQLLYINGRAAQINEIFFEVLNEALANNFEFTDLFKTSLITVNSSTVVQQQSSSEQIDEFF